MYRTWSELTEGCLVRSAWVALMFFKAVLRPSSGCKHHDAVPCVLGKDARRHYLMHRGIALDYGLTGDIHVRPYVSVDKKDICPDTFLFQLFLNK